MNGIHLKIDSKNFQSLFRPASLKDQPFTGIQEAIQSLKSPGSVYETYSYRITPEGSNQDRYSDERRLLDSAPPKKVAGDYTQKTPDELAEDLLNF